MANIKEVAKLAGVSISTVSRAISGSAKLSPATMEKVQAAIEELHYAPDYIAQALKKGSTHTISLIVPTILNPYFPKLLDSFNAEINRAGYATFLNISNYSKENELLSLESSKAFSVDGIVYVPSTDDTEHIKKMVECGIPIVVVNRSPDVRAVCVTNNDRLGSFKATEHLINNGHRRICFFVGNTDLQHMRGRYEGCCEAMEKYGIPRDAAVFCHEDSLKSIFEKSNDVLSSDSRVTAFFASNDWMTKAIYSAIKSHKMSIPGDISVVGFDDIDDSQYMFPPLTTWQHPVTQIVQEAVSQLIKQIENVEEPEHRLYVKSGCMMIRESVRAI